MWKNQFLGRAQPVVFALCLALGAIVPSAAPCTEEATYAPALAAYDSAESAFISVFVLSGLGRRAYRENREYAAAIYQLADGGWRVTPVQRGEELESSIPYHAVPANAQRIVGAHTHGQPRIPGDDEHLYGLDFSRADRNNALRNFLVSGGRICGQLVLSSNLRILRLNLHTAPVTTAPNAGRPLEVTSTEDILGQLAEPGPLLVAARGADAPAAPLQPMP